MNKKLTRNIILAMILGAIFGSIFHFFSDVFWVRQYLVNGILDIVGTIFITLMKMLVVPLVLVSIICGTSNISDPKILGRVGGKAICLYIMTTAIAISLAISIALLFNIGAGANIATTDLHYNTGQAQSLTQTILGLFTENPFKSFEQGNLLQIIVFAILFGLAISLTQEPSRQRINQWFQDINNVIMSLTNIVINLTPYGVFALISKLVITTEFSKFLHIFSYFFTVLLVLIIHLFITNGILIGILARLNPIKFFSKLLPVQLFAFSTASSNATIPLTLDTAENKVGIDRQICGFSIPLGATINMDGTAIMQGAATVFIAHIYNIDLSLSAYITVILTATLSSIGTAGIPSIGLITLTLVLSQVGLPVEGIALIIGIDRILDMVRTAVNITGDLAVSTVIAKSENYLHKDIFDK
ncbi:dicarboxylate/amino acid:cation symporter [Francisella uliginis]|uniref:Sodium:dicarboxylate symporter n=1 Tax=Francisella uliginis TaxID=573570 RepID=A0A1L4BTZ3_9GAMM|nr:dicarboxylate/amino acid:cation symporter [Francisella uliginis]API87309.1 sodium:dicarboxylate symporter [Francisella uliginis]